MQRPSHASQPLAEEWLTLFQDCTIRVEPQAISRIRNDAGLRIHLGDGFLSPLQRQQGQQG
jgi:hypothetical protein